MPRLTQSDKDTGVRYKIHRATQRDSDTGGRHRGTQIEGCLCLSVSLCVSLCRSVYLVSKTQRDTDRGVKHRHISNTSATH